MVNIIDDIKLSEILCKRCKKSSMYIYARGYCGTHNFLYYSCEFCNKDLKVKVLLEFLWDD